MNVSVLILTHNEEVNLPGCLESVAWSDDIVVFDSLSIDRTVEIAKVFSARVIQKKFDNYAAQRNAALSDVQYKHPWILMIDADERCTADMHKEILKTLVDHRVNITMFRLRRKDYFLGRWLRHSSGYPTWISRLLKAGQVSVSRDINEEYVTDGKIGYLQSHYLHYPFNKGIAYWLQKHNGYSSMEATALIQEVRGRLETSALFSRDPAMRRKAQKQLAYRLPGRPLFMFFALYVIRLGFLDGLPGLYYCLLRSIYELMIDLKVMEIRRREKIV